MKICFDNIVYSLQKIGGISIYWGEISKRLLKSENEIYFIDNLEFDNLVRAKLDIDINKIFKKGIFPIKIDRFLDIPLSQYKEKFIFHSSYNRLCSNKNAIHITTIHDFTHEYFYEGARRFIHSIQKGRSIKNAQGIIAISENTKNDILNFYPSINSDNIKVIYNGVSDGFYEIKKSKECEQNFVLFVGSRQLYKNFHFVVELLKIWTSYELIVVGPNFQKNELEMLKPIMSRTTLLSNISEEQLNILYNNASVLLYPSSYEGFGIPLVESMKAGLPFIALNKSSIPEVAGNAGILIDSLNLDDFSDALLKIEKNRAFYVTRGLERAKFFSWDNCYNQTLEFYNSYL